MPSPDEMRQDPRAAAEGRQKAQQLPPGHVKEFAEVTKKEADKATEDLRNSWQGWWDLWQNQVRYADKEEWQSQIFVGKSFSAVEQAGSIIQRSLLDSPEFFGVDGANEDAKLLAAHIWKPLLRLTLDNAGYVPKFSDCSKVGFITGVAGYRKYRWLTSQTPVLAGAQVDPATGKILPSFTYRPQSMLAIDYVHPWQIFRDPWGSRPRENFSGSYLWHSQWLDRPQLQAMVDRGWDKDAVTRLLDKRQDETTGDKSLPNSQQAEADRKLMAWDRHKFRRAYCVDEGWCDLLDQNGDVVFPNCLVIHSHGEIILPPQDSPIWATDLQTGRRKWPFIAGSPIVHPSRFEGRGILEQDEGLSLMFSNSINLFADGMNWKFNPGSELYQAGLADWNDTADYPGKIWKKNIKEQILMPAQRGEVRINEVMAFLNFLDQERAKVNFITEFVQGLPGSRSDITLGETQLKTAQSLGMFDAIGRSLEDTGRADVELAYDFLMQYLGGNDYTDPSIVSILGPEKAFLLARMPLAERVRELQFQGKFTFTGVTQALMKADQLQKVMEFAKLMSTAYFTGITSPSQLARVIAQLLGLDDRIDIWEPPPMMPGMPGMPMMMGPGMPTSAGAPNPNPQSPTITRPQGLPQTPAPAIG